MFFFSSICMQNGSHLWSLALEKRKEGRCPLEPGEIGIILRAMGYTKETQIYVASGQVYGGSNRMAPLRNMFPNLVSASKFFYRENISVLQVFTRRFNLLHSVFPLMQTYCKIFTTTYKCQQCHVSTHSLLDRIFYRWICVNTSVLFVETFDVAFNSFVNHACDSLNQRTVIFYL